jgi:hypothetical protein
LNLTRPLLRAAGSGLTVERKMGKQRGKPIDLQSLFLSGHQVIDPAVDAGEALPIPGVRDLET